MAGCVVVELYADVALGGLKKHLSALGTVLCPDCEDSRQGTEDDEKSAHLLLLEERGYPQDDDGTDDGSCELSDDAAQLNLQQREQPAAQGTAQQTQNQVHDEAEAAALHQLAGTEASETSKKNRIYNTHSPKVLIILFIVCKVTNM